MLQYAAENYKNDREVVLTAVKQNWQALQFASDALLEDTSFAADDKKIVRILRISLMSGRYTCVAALKNKTTESLISEACVRLLLRRRGSERLLQGTSVVPARIAVQHWPGIESFGEITDYQLIV
eukprot:1906026-Amphidinium_carterae.1